MPLRGYAGPSADRKALRLLKDQLLDIWYFLRQNAVLFSEEKSVDLLKEVAPDLFGSLQDLIRDHIVMEMTTVAEDRNDAVSSIVNFHRANREALSDERARQVDELLESLAKKVSPMRKFRGNFIAHKNKKTLLSLPAQGGFTLKDIEEAWGLVQKCIVEYDPGFSGYGLQEIEDLSQSARSLLNYLEDSGPCDADGPGRSRRPLF